MKPAVSAAWKGNNTVLITYTNATVGFQAVRIGTVFIGYENKN